ncbi:hypothetical protein [Prauserella muralis]|uniref:Uncharacterized protein n=1 Tax=Prauserella muralis TaxID=588067 RepID=A0A2V4ACL7_9PSEU|nr:hypothetical protein [Prauserella muralis]PXY16994.1 hypothetical protein BAY60_34900 [Prauserella muralis]TWE23641.1 hypothetical protein FHX69_4932 [Prauserella muralis]
MTSAAAAPRRGGPVPPDAPVLATRPLRPGTDLDGTSRFADDVWDLDAANHQVHTRRWILNFPTLPAAFRPVAKELFYALLAGEPPPGETRSSLGSIRGRFTQVKKFLWWADRRGIRALADVTADDLLAFHHWLQSQDLGPSQRGAHRGAVRAFWLYRHVLHSDALPLDPSRIEEWTSDNSKPARRSENRTDRIPEQVISPLLVWALRWVSDFAPDVVAARAEWWPLYIEGRRRSALGRRGQPPIIDRAKRAETRERLRTLLANYRAAGRPLPGNADGQVNEHHLARQIGRYRSAFRYPTTSAMISEAVAELGIADDTYLITPVRAQVHGRPWLARIRFADVPTLTRMLAAACYVVIAYLSGMRDSEVKHMRRGCLTRKRDRDGAVVRRVVTSQAFKGEGTPTGVRATWVVSETVEHAVAVLEQLQPPEVDFLFAPLPGSAGYRYGDAGDPQTTTATNRVLNAFVDWINTYCGAHDLPDIIPLVRKQRWMLSTSQFRRTLAWFIARRPGGSIAGAIQYRHHSIQMFEGYAGTSDSGFRAEVEAEQTLERGERLLAMIDGHEHHDLRGPAAGEAQARLAEFGRKVAYAGSVVTDPKRLAKIMKRDDPKIYFGEFVTCVHNPAKALCRRKLALDGRTALPDLGDCQPLRCRNVALTPDNLAALATQLSTLDTILESSEVLAPYVAHRLEQQRCDLAALLAAAGHDPQQHPDQRCIPGQHKAVDAVSGSEEVR